MVMGVETVRNRVWYHVRNSVENRVQFNGCLAWRRSPRQEWRCPIDARRAWNRGPLKNATVHGAVGGGV